MHMNVRKMMALLVSLAMLCACIPMGAMTSVSAAETIAYFNDFESGSVGTWKTDKTANGTVEVISSADVPVANPDAGNYVLKYTDINYSYAYNSAAFSVDANTDYTFTYSVLSTRANHQPFKTLIGTNAWFGTQLLRGEPVPSNTEWNTYTYTFNSGNNTSVFVGFQPTWKDVTYYVDNIKIEKATDDPDAPTMTNLLLNGDFEAGEENWTFKHGSHAIETNGVHGGSKALKLSGPITAQWPELAVSKAISATPGDRYTITWYAKRVSGEGVFNLYIDGDYDQTTDTGHNWMVTSDGDYWVKYEWNMAITSSSFRLKFSSEEDSGTNPGVIMIDDVTVTKDPTTTNDGYIINGGFESGDKTGWNVHGETAVNTATKHEGNYGALVKGDGKWGGLLNQSFALQPNREYILRFDIKCVQQGVNIKITDELGIAGGNNNANLWSAYYDAKNGTDWRSVEIYFSAGDNTTAKFNVSGSGQNTTDLGKPATGLGDEVWIDNVSIEKVGGDDPIPNTILIGSLTSIRDAAPNSYGLAFKFTVIAAGAEKLDTNEYVSKSATVKPYQDLDDTYKLIRAGAIMTNNMTVGKNDMTMEDVDGKKVVDVPAKYIINVNNDRFDFSARIINIPEGGLDTNIYARPYYIYEDADGNQVIGYGATKSENYNHKKNPKASIKLMAIGNSFSQDAINNHLYEVLESAGYEEIVLANMYIGGCSLDTHWGNMKDDAAAYTYYYRDATTNGWRTTSNAKLSDAINDTDWDYITIQQVSGSSGRPGDYGNLNNCLNWINDNKTNPNAKILWHMTWAYDDLTSNSSFSKYDNDQMKMYTAILDTTNEKILTNNLIDGVIPSGTSIQNMRTSSLLSDDAILHESDGYHLSAKVGDYIAALTWYAYLSGDDVSDLAYQPTEVASFRDDINTSVNGAIANPYQVTKCASYDKSKSIKVLSIGHSFSRDVMGTYLYNMLEQAGYEDITLGYLYYPGCSLARHWENCSKNLQYKIDNDTPTFSINNNGSWNSTNNPYAIQAVRGQDWDFVTLQVSPDYVGGDKISSGAPGAGKSDYDFIPNMIEWVQENCLTANVPIMWHMIWAFSEGCDLWSYTYHGFDQQTMYNNIVEATQQYVATNENIAGIIPCGTAVQNGRALLGDIFNEPDASQGGRDGYHLNSKYGDFIGSLTWTCYFSGVDAHTITERSSGMTDAEFSAIADAVNAALADWTQVTVG